MTILTIIIIEELFFFIKYCKTTAVLLFTERRQLGQFLLRLNVTFYTKMGNRTDIVGLRSSL